MKLQNLFKKKLDVLVEMRKQDKNSAIDEIGHMGIIVILYHMFDNHTAAYLLLGVYVFGILANAVRINEPWEGSIRSTKAVIDLRVR